MSSAPRCCPNIATYLDRVVQLVSALHQHGLHALDAAGLLSQLLVHLAAEEAAVHAELEGRREDHHHAGGLVEGEGVLLQTAGQVHAEDAGAGTAGADGDGGNGHVQVVVH